MPVIEARARGTEWIVRLPGGRYIVRPSEVAVRRLVAAEAPGSAIAFLPALDKPEDLLSGALRAEVDTTVAMRPDARPSRGARPDAGSTLDSPVVATFPPNDVAVIPPATHRAPGARPGPGGPSPDPTAREAAGASSSARPPLRGRPHPAVDRGQRGDVQLPLLSG